MQLAGYRALIKDQVAFYPVRKAASSRLSVSFGGEPIFLTHVPSKCTHISVVRNPFDRLASLYYNNREDLQIPECTMEDFITIGNLKPFPLNNHHFWAASSYLPRDTITFYYEDLANEALELSTYLTSAFVCVTSEGPKYKFTPGFIEAVIHYYKNDLVRFYENSTSPLDCHTRGKAAARLRRESSDGIGRQYCLPFGSAPTDSSSE